MTSNYELKTSEPLQQQRRLSSQSQLNSWDSFKHHIPRLIITAFVDVIAPLLLYFAIENHMKPFYALLIASSPPLFMTVFKAIWVRSFDAIGFLVFFAFMLAAILAYVLHNPKILLFEKSLFTGVGAIIFAITLIPFECSRFRWRPIVFYFYHDLLPVTRAEFGLPDNLFDSDQYTELKDNNQGYESPNMKEVTEVYTWLYDHSSSFRATCYFMTGVWAVCFSIECVFRYLLILSQAPINLIFIYGQILFMVIVILCVVLQIASMVIERKHTLAYIEQWKMQHISMQQPQKHSLTPSTEILDQVE